METHTMIDVEIPAGAILFEIFAGDVAFLVAYWDVPIIASVEGWLEGVEAWECHRTFVESAPAVMS